MSHWPLEQVISGCQTGADQAGLFAAEALGIPTGGCVTRANRTESGDRPDLVARFRLTPLPTEDYAVRTLANVKASDGTVIFGSLDCVEERGTALTIRLVAFHKGADHLLTNPTVDQLRAWIVAKGICVLNVAGPRLSRDPHVYDRAMGILLYGLQPAPGAIRIDAALLKPLAIVHAPRRNAWQGRRRG